MQVFDSEVGNYPVYHGDDLGLSYSPQQCKFRLWAPTAQEVELRLYSDGHTDSLLETHAMQSDTDGTWLLVLDGKLRRLFYTYRVRVGDNWLAETPDPYSIGVGTNGLRSYIIDLLRTDPEGWDTDIKPPLKSFADIVLYEAHVRDLTVSETSGVSAANRGRFLGLTEHGTLSPQRETTGIDHLVELGITHLHLLPIYDFMSVDDTKRDGQYNWGYDPQHYNVPEGWYASDPYNPKFKIKEMKQLVQAMHKSGIRVVMDVVYNHTGFTRESVFERTVPGYYYRITPTGAFSNASGCGNEIASERAMVRKYIVNSVKYWATEYHIDGFRFDLMGILDIETMHAIRNALDEIDPTIFIYGEGWTGGLSPLPDHLRALKHNTSRIEGVASFSDDFRDAIKGHWSSEYERGFISGQDGYEESVKFGIVAANYHTQVNYAWVNYSKHPWANSPLQTINFVSCHDNHTLWDKLKLSVPEATEDQMLKMQKLANGIILTSQGIPLLHAGVELSRTKNYSHNSYNLPDAINQIDWNRKSRYKGLFLYYKGLIALRRSHPAFRMDSTEMINKHLNFLKTEGGSFVAYHLRDHANNDSWQDIVVAYNGSRQERFLRLPFKAKWVMVADKSRIDVQGMDWLVGEEVIIPSISLMILYRSN